MKKILSFLITLLGVAIFLFGRSTAQQAEQGEEILTQTEQSLESPKRPIAGPVRRHAREQASTQSAEKIGAKQMQIGQTESTANWLQGAGIALFVIGMSCLLFSFTNKQKD